MKALLGQTSHNALPVVENVDPKLLKAKSRNARRHGRRQKEKVKRSIEKFGIPRPILVGLDNTIIDGHLVHQIALELGLSTIPIIRVSHLSAAEIESLSLVLNRTAELGSWDEAILGEIFEDLFKFADAEFEPLATGFDTAEIDRMLGLFKNSSGPESSSDKDTCSAPVSRVGDLWLAGRHRIFCGNALERSSYQTVMGETQAAMVFADPPYNVPIAGNVSGLGKARHREFAMASGEMSKSEFTDFLSSTFKLLAEFSADGSLHYLCMDWRHLREMIDAGEAHYSRLVNMCVWAKDNGGMGSLYRSRHELVFVYQHGKTSHQNNIELGRHGRNRTNVWDYPSASTISLSGYEGDLLSFHPTAKPVPLVADAILDCTSRGDVVMDCFLGSGTTLLAAERTKRVCHGIELDPLYVDTAIRRWQDETGGQAVLAATGETFDARNAVRDKLAGGSQ